MHCDLQQCRVQQHVITKEHSYVDLICQLRCSKLKQTAFLIYLSDFNTIRPEQREHRDDKPVSDKFFSMVRRRMSRL